MTGFDYLIGIVAFVFVLGLIVAVHEGGHFFFARRAGILVREFAFGMGPQLWKKKKGETVYSIRAFPIGGFCAIAGEEVEDDPFKSHPRVKLDIVEGVIKGFYLNIDDDSLKLPICEIVEYDVFDEQQTGNLFMEVINNGERIRYSVDPQAFVYDRKIEYQIAPYNRTLGSKSKRARAMVMFGGPLMNFILALVVFLIAGLLQGFPNQDSSQISGMVASEAVVSPAYQAGLRNDDIITNLKSGDLELSVNKWYDISEFMQDYTQAGKLSPIEVTYLRDSKESTVSFMPQISFFSIAASAQIIYENNSLVGLKVLDIVNAEDEMINNMELLKGDIITKVDNITVDNLDDVFNYFQNFQGNNDVDELNFMPLTVIRDGEVKNIKIKPYSKDIMNYQQSSNGIPVLKVAMGIEPSYKFNFGQSFVYSVQKTGSSFTAIFDTLGMLFNKTITIKSLSGFVGIFNATTQFAKSGFINLLNWMGLLSVNVGLLNLLPIPALDGGRLVFLGYEAITNKKPNQKVETALITVTMLLLFGLMIYVTINDILRFFK